MVGTKKVICVIPARLESTRFPHKVLKDLAGKPLLQWVFEAASKVDLFDAIVFAVDAQQTAKLVESFGAPYVMTSVDCPCGTDRLVEVMESKRFDADIWVDWQADEPFITTKMIEQLLATCQKDDADVWTLKKRIEKKSDILCPNIAKVVCDANSCALYLSRNAIPFYRDQVEVGGENQCYYKHVGLFAFSTAALEKISMLKVSDLEMAEKLEQLRFLQYGLKIKLHETDQEVVGIDTPHDLERAEAIVKG